MTIKKPLLPPKLTLILGTDASGKDHIATHLSTWLNETGHPHERREGRFSKKETFDQTSEDKGRFSLFAEASFIKLYPVFGFLLPLLVSVLIHVDLRFYRKSEKHVVVVSHTALRLLAFHLGHQVNTVEEIELSPHLDRLLKRIVAHLPVKTIVLDIEDSVRKQRIADRHQRGKVDPFDRYMAQDEHRSERIEAILVWLATNYLEARVIENNDLAEEELKHHITEAFHHFHSKQNNVPHP